MSRKQVQATCPRMPRPASNSFMACWYHTHSRYRAPTPFYFGSGTFGGLTVPRRWRVWTNIPHFVHNLGGVCPRTSSKLMLYPLVTESMPLFGHFGTLRNLIEASLSNSRSTNHVTFEPPTNDHERREVALGEVRGITNLNAQQKHRFVGGTPGV